MKRFVPPLLKRPPTGTNDAPPAKKQKGEEDSDSSSRAPKPARVPSGLGGFRPLNALRKPLLSVKNPAPKPSTPVVTPSKELESSTGAAGDVYYNVLWRKITNKKHKTFDGDGVLSLSGGYATLQDQSGQNLGRTMMSKKPELGDIVKVGGKEVEIDNELSRADYLAGRPFLKVANTTKPMTPAPAPVQTVVLKSFKTPLLQSTVMPKKNAETPTPRHDPKAENALIMPRPKMAPQGKRLVDVVVDPFLSQHLRPHQREGVEFMYSCVMGLKNFEGRGCILADEMGLGKTLQTIALVWTLLKQNPIYMDKPVVKKALIVCPVTLINNWKKEFRKWLGNERIGVFVCDSNADLRDFIRGKTYPVAIIGYEKLQKVHGELKKANIDIVIADEGHRLKTDKNKSAQAITALNTPRKIILSGTPLQNDLHEFFTMVDFVNPGLLETYSTFRKEFENPVLKSRQPNASPKDIEKGKARSETLAKTTSMFILRRTAEILSAFLPPKKEYVLFCQPTTRQLEVYRSILESQAFKRCLGSPEASLLLITVLKKLCNSPGLLGKAKDGKEQSEGVKGLLADVGDNWFTLTSKSASSSGKLRVLDRLVGELKTTTDEKIVIVSNYTSTLDMLQSMLITRGLTFLRLDGSTPQDKRQQLVDRFNKVNSDEAFAFLLSAKSGGAGINLIGASRLVLFDLDWNPATDAQAMARIHRDGQKKPVMIYRMLTTGCFDEKIFQRQITKQGLADSIIDSKSSASAFTQAELKNLFTLDEETSCQTHDLMACPCGGKGYIANEDEKKKLSSTSESQHSDDDDPPTVAELVRGSLMKASQVTDEIISGKNPTALTKEGLGALMGHDHVLTNRLKNGEELDDEDGDVTLEDEVLMKVLTKRGKEKECSFVFQKCF